MGKCGVFKAVLEAPGQRYFVHYQDQTLTIDVPLSLKKSLNKSPKKVKKKKKKLKKTNNPIERKPSKCCIVSLLMCF